jgi:hypothetical protein
MPRHRDPQRAEAVRYVFDAVLDKADNTTVNWAAKPCGSSPVRVRSVP